MPIGIGVSPNTHVVLTRPRFLKPLLLQGLTASCTWLGSASMETPAYLDTHLLLVLVHRQQAEVRPRQTGQQTHYIAVRLPDLPPPPTLTSL
jgi:hypothetical protein